ncbi:MAG: S46 family peptidase [Phycisphaerae bacterium]|nr:S46 family peptidase [Phycisphaerae bacterium]
MGRTTRRLVLGAWLALAGATLGPNRGARADEGMWLINRPPTAAIKAACGIEPDAAWFEHIQRSCVRIGTGGSGSIVSADGLLMTNHHVGSDAIAKLSTPDRDLLEEGFLALSRADERRCPGLEVRILWQVSDVTDRVLSAVKPGSSDAEAGAAKRAAMTSIEAEAQQRDALVSEVVTLYQGARYHLYQYRRYDDVRLVFAPEQQAAFFGGDADNFEFPRFNLDVCFFRIYDDGKPLRPEHHLGWAETGVADQEPVFVFGHPGRTRRLYTLDHLAFLRDVELPARLARVWRTEVKLQTYSGRSRANARAAADDLLGVQNGRKVLTGQLAGLLDPALMARKRADETALRAFVESDPERTARWSDAWTKVAEAQRAYAAFFHRYDALGRGRPPLDGDLFDIAWTLTRWNLERTRPNEQRLREYRDSEADTIRLKLFAETPFNLDLEKEKLAAGLTWLAERLGGGDPRVVEALGGKSPADRAAELVDNAVVIRSVQSRKFVEPSGRQVIEKNRDTLIRLALALEGEARQLRVRYEDEVESVERAAYAKVAAARFAKEGENLYPDATFTLRVSFGAVRGYRDGGASIPAFTTIGGMFTRAADRAGDPAFALPDRWAKRRDKLDPKTPFNFICTADIIGGNSGSPVVNKDGKVIGLIFDGNIHSLVGDFVYDGTLNRALAVDARAIAHALDVLYDAKDLVKEITGKQ